MATYYPIAYTIPQYDQVNLKNWWLKAYDQGTTTPMVISVDAAGSTTLAKVELDSSGFPITAGSARFIPHLTGYYDLWLFPTEAEADANDTSNAIQVADNINTNQASLGFTKTYLTRAAMVADAANVVINDRIYIIEETTGSGSGNWFLAVDATTVTEDEVVILTGSATVSFVKKYRDGSDVVYTPVGTNAVATNVQAKIQELESVNVAGFLSIADAFTHIGTLTDPVHVLFPAQEYTLAATVDCVLPEGTVITAHGAKFTCTHDGVAFDINSAATATIPRTATDDDVTLRDITWSGGRFLNTNVTKSASVAIQAYYMRGFFVNDVYAADFYAGFKFGAKDTYVFTNCYTFNCNRHYWVPDAGILFTEAVGLAGNDLIGVTLANCHLSLDGDEAGVYSENRIIGFRAENTLFNGGATIAQCRFTDASYLYSRGLSFSNCHFEQIAAAKPAVLFDAANNQGHYNISFDDSCEFVSGTIGWYGVTLSRCQYVKFGSVEFSDGSGGATEQGIYVDDNSRHIVIEEGCHFLSFTTGQEIVLQTATNRQYISIEPNFIPDAVVLTGYNGVTKSSGTETIDMSTAYTNFGNYLLPPKAYAISTQARDSASASTTANLRVLKDATVSVSSGVGINLLGVSNDDNRQAAGIVQCDSAGDLYSTYTASGTGTLTIFVNINGVYQ